MAALLADAPWRRLAVFGDSVAEGVGDPVPGYRDLSRVARVEDRVRRQVRRAIAILNAVSSGVTERYGGLHVDFFAHPALGASLFSADLLQPNRRGHACIASDLVRELGEHVRPGVA